MRTPSIAAVLPSGEARGPVLLLSLGSFALGTDAFVISGVLPKVGQDLGVSLAVAGALITIFSAVYAVGAPILAVATGNMPRKRILLASMALFVVANLLAAVAPNYTVMMIARVVAAIGAATYMPAASAVAATISEPAERGRALAAVLGGLTLATALGVPFGTLIGQAISWRYTFVFVAVLGVLAWVGLARALGMIPTPPVVSLRDRITIGAKPGIPTALLATVLAITGIFMVYTYLAWFSDKTAGINGTALTTIYLVYGLAAVVSNFVAGYLIDRHSPTRVALISMGGLVVAFALLALLAGATGGPSPAAVTLLFLVVVGWSLIGWMFNPAQQQRLLGASGPEGPVVLSLNASAIYAGQAVGGLVGGLLLAGGPATLALVGGVFELVAVGALLISARRLTRTEPADEPSGKAAPSSTANAPAPSS